VLFFVVGLAAAIITLAAISGERGYADVRRQRAELSRVRAEVDCLHRENLALLQEVRALRKDPFVIEQIAREKLGYARPGEIVFQFPATHPSIEDVPPPTPTEP
jgi:cell division protein FtsB